ncbi:MAG: hypothetical protein U0269_33625 [Polyangiales bacterium]
MTPASATRAATVVALAALPDLAAHPMSDAANALATRRHFADDEAFERDGSFIADRCTPTAAPRG